ncbi:hypothetical protein [Nannocystis bainbridge]|uniref:Uncharacterized protein n=1 Tax=Nannocystis bainbridge TaxID=2995303 RepID=A0ABT5DRU7_9BACT|nr:hypothetical protein [Nannocystis bainbridge]MDC0715858.1 hypothetical protein [Nannocystis bainbridge]
MRRTCIALVLALSAACGQDSDSTETAPTAGTAETTDTSTTTTTASTTAEPTSTSSTTAEDTTDTGTSTEPAPACETSAMECGIDVGPPMSSCPDMEDPASLVVEVLGAGHIRFTEYGHDAACNLSFSPNVKLLSNNSLLVIYDIGGNPMDSCVCKYNISAEISNLASGTWTIQVASFMEQFEVL